MSAATRPAASSAKRRVAPRPNSDEWKNRNDIPLMHWVMALLGLLPPSADEVPRAKAGDKVPVYSEFNQLFFPVPFALLPTAVRYYCYYYTDMAMPSLPVMAVMMSLYFIVVGALIFRHFNNLVRKYGYLDSGVGRDTVPFEMMPKIIKEVITAGIVRPGLVVLAIYDPKEAPSLTWWLPLQLFVLTAMEDFTYYWFHRLCHVADSCWAIHRLHHTTKHPTSILLGYADDLQEFVDLAGAPMLSWLMCPFGFDVTLTWIFVQTYVQVGGHCGARLHFGTILTGPYLRPFGLDLIVEDHDLHHRHGWKDSYNYGKQSRLWDSLYGTTGDRLECYEGNLYRKGILGG